MRRGARTALQTLVIVVLAGLGAGIHASLRPVSIPRASLAAGGSAASGPSTEPGGAGGSAIRTITLADARALYDANTGVFIDARDIGDYRVGHIPGAFWLPLSQFFTGKPPAITQDLPQDMTIVVYCEGGDCHASRQVAIMLLDYGFTDPRVLEIGYPGWKEAGYPTEAGEPFYGS